MKTLFIIYSVLAVLLMSHSSFAATSNEAVKFRYIAADMDVQTTGKTKHQAREKASETCFDKRMDEYEARRGSLPDEEQSMAIIDSCVNI